MRLKARMNLNFCENYCDKNCLNKWVIPKLENTGNVAEEFDAGMWCGLVDHVTVTDKENTVFTFKNGFETKVS